MKKHPSSPRDRHHNLNKTVKRKQFLVDPNRVQLDEYMLKQIKKNKKAVKSLNKYLQFQLEKFFPSRKMLRNCKSSTMTIFYSKKRKLMIIVSLMLLYKERIKTIGQPSLRKKSGKAQDLDIILKAKTILFCL